MASLISRLWSRLSTKRGPLSIMLVGLDNSGKTSILNYLASLHQGGGTTAQQQQFHRQHINHSSARSSPMLPTESCPTSAQNDRTATTSGVEGNIMPTVGYNYERIHYKNLCITVLDFSGQSRYRNLWQEFYNGVDGIVFVIDSSDIIRFVVVRDELETMLNHPYFTLLVSGDEFNHRQTIATFPNSASLTTQKQLVINQGKLIQTPLDMAPSTNSPPIGTHRTSSEINSGPLRRSLMSKPSGKRRTKIPILFLANKTDLANSVDAEAVKKALNLSQLLTERHPYLVQATSVNLNQGITDAFDWLADQLLSSDRTAN